MKRFFIFAVVAALSVVSAFADAVTLNKRSDWSKHPHMKIVDGNILEFRGGRVDVFSTPFVIEPGKKYIFSAEFRNKPGTPSGVIYIGNWSMRGSWRLIPENVLFVKNSDAKVLEDAAANSNTIVIAKPACWTAKGVQRTWNLAVNTQGDFSDLPNKNIYRIDKAQVEGDRVIITLKTKLTAAVKANSNVRLHNSSVGMYGGASNVTPTEEWQRISWSVSNIAPLGSNPANQWWAGADKGAIRIIANYKKTQGASLQVRNVTMEVAE